MNNLSEPTPAYIEQFRKAMSQEVSSAGNVQGMLSALPSLTYSSSASSAELTSPIRNGRGIWDLTATSSTAEETIPPADARKKSVLGILRPGEEPDLVAENKPEEIRYLQKKIQEGKAKEASIVWKTGLLELRDSKVEGPMTEIRKFGERGIHFVFLEDTTDENILRLKEELRQCKNELIGWKERIELLRQFKDGDKLLKVKPQHGSIETSMFHTAVADGTKESEFGQQLWLMRPLHARSPECQ